MKKNVTFKIVALALTCLFCLCRSAPAMSESTRLNIQGFPPQLPTEIAGNAWFIFLDGVIDQNAPKRFDAYVRAHDISPLSIVYLNSPGGDLTAGIELGQLIRKHGFSTDIGEKPLTSRQRFDTNPGGCFSACAYAYLGGQFRYLEKGSRYGVHQFAPSGTNKVGIDTAQIASAIVVEYIRSMGVDPALFESAAVAEPKEINILDRKTLEALNVVNNGRTRPKWTIESAAGHIYLKGERLTEVSGVNKFMIVCENGAPKLYVIFSTLRRDRELMAMPASSLLIDDTSIPIRIESRSIRSGFFNGIYQLSARDIQAILNAKTVGIAMRFTYEAPVFLGFQGMPIGAGKQKLAGLLNTCRRR